MFAAAAAADPAVSFVVHILLSVAVVVAVPLLAVVGGDEWYLRVVAAGFAVAVVAQRPQDAASRSPRS